MKPFQDADRGTHDRVLKWVAHRPGGIWLDAPSGHGAMRTALERSSFRVVSLDRNLKRLREIPDDRVCGNLHQSLPFASSSFDGFVCVEGIEHLHDPFHLAAEAQRVVKPGGYWIITTPNILNVRSRLRFLFSGFYNKFRRPLPEDSTDLSLHIMPLSLWQIRYIVAQGSFTIEKIFTNRVKLVDLALLLVAPVIAAGTFLIFLGEKERRQRRRNWTVFRQLISWPVLSGQALIVIARKK
ncbi:MAG: class I SAM-dependent methyltransferase [Acidobacteriota bacterium]